MSEILRSPITRVVVQLALLMIVSVIMWDLLRRWRDRTRRDDLTTDHLNNFREMRRRGDLSEGEFRTIKTVLGARIRDEINDNGKSG